LQYTTDQKLNKGVYEFKDLIGKKPFVMFYFLPAHAPSVTELQALATASNIFGSKVQFFGVTKATTAEEADVAAAKIKSLKIHLPILLDEKGLMAYVMLTQRVPSYAMVTGSGRFTLARASALAEKVSETDSMLGMINRVSRGEETPFTIAPGYSPNPFDMIAKPAPNFQAKDALVSQKTNLAEYVKQQKTPVLLAFWSITCPHCHQTMPILYRYAQRHKHRFRLLSMAVIHKPEYKKMLQEYFDKEKFSFPVLNDPKGDTFNDYRIMTVPTLYLIDRSGIIRNVLLGGGKDVDKVVEHFLHKLKKGSPVPSQMKKSPPAPSPTTKPSSPR
jgi:thiol-disulfide isomerase/thioredoxin